MIKAKCKYCNADVTVDSKNLWACCDCYEDGTHDQGFALDYSKHGFLNRFIGNLDDVEWLQGVRVLSNEDTVVINDLIENPSEPNQELKDLFKRANAEFNDEED